jgi:hypothetical protein
MAVQGWGYQREREKFWQGPRAPLLPSMPNEKKTSRKGFSKLLDIQREIPSRSPSLSLVG